LAGLAQSEPLGSLRGNLRGSGAKSFLAGCHFLLRKKPLARWSEYWDYFSQSHPQAAVLVQTQLIARALIRMILSRTL